uniref:Ovule protein n=1 Tax=Caenorhabditis tropicalis TaxID=1561998 RepID=A0A1I7V424_9PELO
MLIFLQIVLEVMRIDEYETSDRRIHRTWSYEKSSPVEGQSVVASPGIQEKVESEINLLKDNSYISKNSSPLAHRIKQKRIDQRERLHLN